MQEKFSIFIPTYNRWSVLAKTLKSTLTDNSICVPVTIVDNNSHPEGLDAVLQVIAKFPHIPCKIIKNEMNIGGDANLLRCIALCPTPYVLVLGDDDFLVDDYIAKITRYLSSNVHWGFISFKDRHCEGFSDKTFDSPYEMVRFSNDWSELLFTSTSIVNTEIFRAGMLEAQRAQFTCSSHLVGMLKGWKHRTDDTKHWRFLLSAERLISTSGHARDAKSFDLIHVFAGLPVLEYFFQEADTHSIVRSAVRGGTRRVFKPRVLAKVFFHYTLAFGLSAAWRLMLPIRQGFNYTIGRRAIFYKWYLPLVILIAACLRVLANSSMAQKS
jgi:glycosyltransferase involved in cell wall biosynthesis